mgnify:CR=1 FL=1
MWITFLIHGVTRGYPLDAFLPCLVVCENLELCKVNNRLGVGWCRLVVVGGIGIGIDKES